MKTRQSQVAAAVEGGGVGQGAFEGGGNFPICKEERPVIGGPGEREPEGSDCRGCF